MKYYLILLNRDVVVDICSFDTEEARDEAHAVLGQLELRLRGDPYYDGTQILNQVT